MDPVRTAMGHQATSMATSLRPLEDVSVLLGVVETWRALSKASIKLVLVFEYSICRRSVKNVLFLTTNFPTTLPIKSKKPSLSTSLIGSVSFMMKFCKKIHWKCQVWKKLDKWQWVMKYIPWFLSQDQLVLRPVSLMWHLLDSPGVCLNFDAQICCWSWLTF